MRSPGLALFLGFTLQYISQALHPPPLCSPLMMNFFRRNPDLKLSSRVDTTLSVTLPPQNPDFSSVVPIAHTLTPQQILEDLGVSRNDGLSKNEAARRLESCGENLLQGKVSISAWRVLLGQLGMHLYHFILAGNNFNFSFSQRPDIRLACCPCSELWRSRFRRGCCHRSSYCPQHYVCSPL